VTRALRVSDRTSRHERQDPSYFDRIERERPEALRHLDRTGVTGFGERCLAGPPGSLLSTTTDPRAMSGLYYENG
jgi:hypothetical protein